MHRHVLNCCLVGAMVLATGCQPGGENNTSGNSNGMVATSGTAKNASMVNLTLPNVT